MAKGHQSSRKSLTSKSSWQRLKDRQLKPSSTHKKEKLLSLLRQLSNSNARKKLALGLNSVVKAIDRNSVSVICLCRDTPKNMFDSIVEMCQVKKLNVVCLPGASTSELASAFSVKRATCFAVPRRQEDDTPESTEDKSGLVDGIRDMLVSCIEE
mmetsp:Transcript_16724/g.25121  ORF Transcript_16724/g.25121 Transcript_16724/m.25121 type:complete len:155 (-) Transcript_16724:218-682(-)